MTTNNHRNMSKQINWKRLNSILPLTLSLLSLCWVAGCATKGYDRSEDAARSLHEASASVRAQSVAFESALGSLNDLVTKPASDLKPQFELFSRSLESLVSASKRTDSAVNRMKEKNQAYLESWNKQLADMNYEYIRTNSLARKQEVTASFDAVSRRCNEAKAAVDPLIVYLQDIRRALSTDLTPGGLEAVKGIANHADDTTGKVRTALANLSTELSNSSARLSATVPQQGPTAGEAPQRAERVDSKP